MPNIFLVPQVDFKQTEHQWVIPAVHPIGRAYPWTKAGGTPTLNRQLILGREICLVRALHRKQLFNGISIFILYLRRHKVSDLYILTSIVDLF